MSGVQPKVFELPRSTPAHFSGTAAESWLLGYTDCLRIGQRVPANTLLEILHQRWPRHDVHDLAHELISAINAVENRQTIKVLGDRSVVATIDLERIR